MTIDEAAKMWREKSMNESMNHLGIRVISEAEAPFCLKCGEWFNPESPEQSVCVQCFNQAMEKE